MDLLINYSVSSLTLDLKAENTIKRYLPKGLFSLN